MTEDLQVYELQETYRKADAKGRKKIVAAAVQLLNAQKTLGNGQDDKEICSHVAETANQRFND